jgi:hypothetical protein
VFEGEGSGSLGTMGENIPRGVGMILSHKSRNRTGTCTFPQGERDGRQPGGGGVIWVIDQDKEDTLIIN